MHSLDYQVAAAIRALRADIASDEAIAAGFRAEVDQQRRIEAELMANPSYHSRLIADLMGGR